MSFCQMNTLIAIYQLVFISNTFISNATLKLAKNQANAKQHPELLLLVNYSHSSSTLSSKNIRIYSEKLAKEQVGLYSWDCMIKGYLHYKPIFCYRVAFDLYLMNFFIWRENGVSFSRYQGFCDFVNSIDLKICDVIIDIAS